MQEKDLAFSRLSDIYGFRILTQTEDDCYRILGAIHQRWRSVPGRFKDYISQPKSNGYRSIHTTVSGRDGKRVEIQIRTRQMHDVAESGVAAHWSYRDGVRVQNPFAVDPAKWLEGLAARFENAEDHDEFLEHVKLEMYSDQVFCFTPKGDVVKLPKGATPIDFAYSIHTRIGHSCVGAKVDGLRVPLWTRLKNGQSIEIITAEGQTPQATWIDIAVTGRAKAAIRRSLREEDRERYIKLGRELARVAFEQVGKRATDKALDTAARAIGLRDGSEMLARIGSAELSARSVVARIYPELARQNADTEVEAMRAVIGLPPGAEIRRAQCCQPVPGERIVGITYPGRGPIVHAIDCGALAAFDAMPDRWIDLHWTDGRHAAVHNVTIDVTLSNENGALGRLCTLIGEQNANISDLHFVDRKPDFFRLLIDVDVRNAEHLHAVMMAVELDSEVAGLRRFRDLDRRP
jgi:GTP pyrophosphokinase